MLCGLPFFHVICSHLVAVCVQFHEIKKDLLNVYKLLKQGKRRLGRSKKLL